MRLLAIFCTYYSNSYFKIYLCSYDCCSKNCYVKTQIIIMKCKHANSCTNEGEREDTDENEERCNKNQSIQFDTFKKWQWDFNKDIILITLLDYVTTLNSGKKVAISLQYSVCCRFEEKKQSPRNISDKWIVGTDPLLTSNIHNHRKTDQPALPSNEIIREGAHSC